MQVAQYLNLKRRDCTYTLQVTAAEFETNFNKYLDLAQKENIHITKNGVDIAIMLSPIQKSSVVDELLGVIPDDEFTVKQARQERRYGS